MRVNIPKRKATSNRLHCEQRHKAAGGVIMSLETERGLRLDDLGFLGRGKSKHRPRNDPSLFGGPYPFFQTGDVKAAEFYLSEYSETYNEKGLAQSKLWQPGTLLITIAANIAETAILKIPGCFPDSIVGFVPYEDKADVRFIKYMIDILKLQMQSISRGTTQDNLSVDKLLSFPFDLPPLAVQREIAGILGAYDDLIENNRRRIKVLEEMARNLYREWFVHFRFPGHEQVKMVETEHGMIPEGWEWKAVSQAVEIDPRERIDKTAERPFMPMDRLRTDSMICSAIDFRSGSGGAKFRRGDTLFARITPCLENGKTGYVQFLADDEVGMGSTEYIVFRPRLLGPEHTYLLARDPGFRDHARKSMSGATGRQRVDAKCFAQYLVAVPPPDIASRFREVSEPSFGMVWTLARRNDKLAATRDLLLPKLMSPKGLEMEVGA